MSPQAGMAVTPSSPNDFEALMAQGRAFFFQYRNENAGALANIDKAIECFSQAVLLADDTTNEIRSLTNLGTSYRSRYASSGVLEDLHKSIESLLRGLSVTPPDHPTKPLILTNLGNAYRSLHEHLGELGDLDKAVEFSRQAVLLSIDGDEQLPGRLSNLGLSYELRFSYLGNLEDADRAIEFHLRAVELTPVGHATMPANLSHLGTSYLSRFSAQRQLSESDLEKAIESTAKAVSLCPKEDPDMPIYLTNLGVAHHERFEQMGDISDIHRAIEYHSEAVSSTHDTHPRKPDYLSNLGISHQARFQNTGALIDIDTAIKSLRQALSLTNKENTSKPRFYCNLGNAYLNRFTHTQDLSDLNEAIECHSEALSRTPIGHVSSPLLLSGLGSAYQRRYNYMREPLDIIQAIEYMNQAVLITPDSHNTKPGYLSNLGSAYRDRYAYLGQLEDSKHALEAGYKAVRLAPDSHAFMPTILHQLGITHYIRYLGLRGASDLTSSIEVFHRAISLAAENYSSKSQILNSLGTAYRAQFDHRGNLSDIDKAIQYLEQSASCALQDRQDWSKIMYNLGAAYLDRFNHTPVLEDADNAIIHYAQAAQFTSGDLYTRFRASHAWSRLLAQRGDPSSELAYQHTIELLPRLVWLGTTIEQRYDTVSQIQDLVTEIVSSAISLKLYDQALEWLEASRSIVWGQILQLHTDFDDLLAKEPELATRLKKVAYDLDNAGTRSTVLPNPVVHEPSMARVAKRHVELAAEWDQLLRKVRSIPGFHSFLRPEKARRIKLCATDGCVVVVNLHETRCDALIIIPGSDNIAHVPLERFSTERATHISETLLLLTGGRGFNRVNVRSKRDLNDDEEYKHVLRILWSEVVRPILEYLNYTTKLPVDNLPHLTWCTTGALSFLPLHAAACYQDSEPNVFDFVVSSYTPTLTALLRSYGTDDTPTGLLAVGQANTPGQGPLPYTKSELATIRQNFEGVPYSQLDGDRATVQAVLAAMEQYSCVHLACHATQNIGNPIRSAFHLHNGDLTLAELGKRSFKNKTLAFLSACQTATGEKKLPEESVHLAAGMLVAGYPSVIAAMWSIIDEDGPLVAAMVYKELLKNGKLEGKGAAKALHKAIMCLRDKVGADAIRRWGPFIHLGV